MATLSESSVFESLFQIALEEYETETGIKLVGHPLAVEFEHCDSVESITELLKEKARAFREFRGGDNKVLMVLQGVVEILHKLSAPVAIGQAVKLPMPLINTIHAGIGILLAAVKDVSASYDALVDLLESMWNFLRRLDIYTKVPHTQAMTDIVVKILVQLIHTLAVATKQIKQGRLMKFGKKLFGENDVEAVLHRLDRLTLEEARTTAAQTLEVVYGLTENLRELMSEGRASTDGIQKALEMMQQQLLNDANKSRRDQLRRDVRSWLSPPDPWKNHNIGCETHHEGTARWFIEGEIFSEWKSSNPLLWINGKPGAGKSLLCSSIVEDVDCMRKSGLASFAFYYFDFRDDEKRHRRGLLSSLLFQLCDQSNSYCDILSRVYSANRDGSQSPSEDTLTQCLKDMLLSPRQAPVYLILDALDECPNSFDTPTLRENVLKLVEDLVNLHLPNLRICLTSRPDVDIKKVLEGLQFRSVCLHDEEGQKQDILDYINSVVHSDPKMKKWRAADKERVINELSQRANGMFRWVFCQFDFLRHCLPGRIQRALTELPATLDETYERVLRDIHKANWEFAHRLLQCVTVASRPLRVEELADFLAFDFKDGPIPEFHEGSRPEDPVDAVLSTCPSLLEIVNVEDPPVIQFSHFSVKEYLTSRLAQADNIISRRYRVSVASAHTLSARACLGILLHLDKAITPSGLENFPLAEYAAEHWVDHAQFEVAQNLEAGTKQLFDPRKPHFAVWIGIRNLKRSSSRLFPTRHGEMLPQPTGTPLHYAAFYGFHRIVEFLVIERSQDVGSLGFSDKSTPLHAAASSSYSTSAEATRALLENGADTMAGDRHRRTPLHAAATSSSSNNVEVIRVLLDWGADMSAQDSSRQTPLHAAMWSWPPPRTEVLRALVMWGADLKTKDMHGLTPLHTAMWAAREMKWSSQNWLEVVRALLDQGADTMVQDKRGSTPLHAAAGGSSSSQAGEVIRALLEQGADVTIQDDDGYTPLHMVLMGSYYSPSMEVVQALLDRGASVTVRDKDGCTPLHRAAKSWTRGVGTIRALVERGADVRAQDKNGTTPLHMAAAATARNHMHVSPSTQGVELIKAFLEWGADVTAQDKDGCTPLHAAAEGAACISYSDHQHQGVQIVRALLEERADVTAQDKDRRTPLHAAAVAAGRSCSSMSLQGVEVINALLEWGADVMARDKDGCTPLHDAAVSAASPRKAARRHSPRGVEAIRALLKRGADATAQDKDGRTPLHMALTSAGAFPVGVEIVRALLEGGADLTACDKDGRTPLHVVGEVFWRWSSHGSAIELVQALLKQGADVTAQDDDGHTPLHLTVVTAAKSYTSEGLEVVKALLEQGADVTTQDNNENTPLHLAVVAAASSYQSQSVEVVKYLLWRGADVTAKEKYGCTPLHLAAATASQSSRGAEVVRALLNRGADVMTQDKRGRTPLHAAAVAKALPSESMEIVQILLSWGADAMAQDNEGKTPLHLALSEGHSDIANILLMCHV